MSQKQPDILLLKYSFVLQADGKLASTIDNIDPDEFLKVANAYDWEDATAVSTVLKYLLTQIKALDNDLEKYLLNT